MKKNSEKNSIKLSWNRVAADVPGLCSFKVIERINPVKENNFANRLIHGDNLKAMHLLLTEFEEKIDLIYIDPPYGTGRKFARNEKKSSDSSKKIDFDDSWNGGLEDYLQMIFDRLQMMKRLMSPEGSIYVHVDWHASHYVRVLMDEVFGRENFQNEIVWCYREAVNSKKRWNRKHDLIFFYSKSGKFKFNYSEVLEKHSDSTVKKYRKHDEKGPYRLMGRGISGSPIRSARDVSTEWEEKHPELTFRHYLPEGKLPVDYWMIDIVNQASAERTGYSTQKPEPLIERIIKASSSEGDILADFFCGSGTLPVVASRYGRKWVACDSSQNAIETAKKRLIELTEAPSFDLLEIK